MKPLKTAQQLLVWFCLSLNDGDSISRNRKLARKSFAFIFSVIFIGTVLLSVITFVNHSKISVEEFFIVFYQFSITLNSICGFITIFWFGKEISNVFENLSIICSKCETFYYFSFYEIKNFSCLFLLSSTFSLRLKIQANAYEKLMKNANNFTHIFWKLQQNGYLAS